MTNEEQLLEALGSEASDRLQYAEMISAMKCVFTDMAGPSAWMIEASNNWDALPTDQIEMVGEVFYQVAKHMDEVMENFYNILQSNAQYLFGEKLPERAFHAPDCTCEIEEE